MKPLIILKNRPLVYCIYNTVNKKVYVGKTKCIWKRCHQYLSDVRCENNADRMNDYLYRSMVKHGVESFEMFPLEFTDDESIAERELWWMHHLNSLNRNKGYNLRSDSSTGMIVHDNTKKLISERLKREWAEGKRDGHSAKLKKSWDGRNRNEQGKLFSKTLTKYKYVVTYEDGRTETYLYKELEDRGFSNVLAKFHGKKSNRESFKNVVIERIRNE
jgi:group I intron endonuclease